MRLKHADLAFQTAQTPTTENDRYGNIDLMALAVRAVQHIKDQITDHALEIAATATGGAHMATWKDRSIENAIDEIGGSLYGSIPDVHAQAIHFAPPLIFHP